MATHHVAVRLEPEAVARVDALIPRFTTPWRRATRSEVLRACILDALERFEVQEKADAKPAKKGGRR